MGHEFIGECTPSGEGPVLDDYEMELVTNYIKQECGKPPRGVDVEVTWEGHEVGNEGDEVSYPIISVVWDDSVTESPDDYIGKCIEAFDRFDSSEEIHEQYRKLFDLQDKIRELLDPE